jgi:hypothetical protein
MSLQWLLVSNAVALKLSWAETAKAMAAAREIWSDWDVTAGDGLHDLNKIHDERRAEATRGK